MKSKKATKRALLSSALSLVLCFSMLLGTTFAWFTDEAKTGVNTIQSGTLDIQLLADDGVTSLEGKSLQFVKADAGASDDVLWEPGATYYTQGFQIKNNGNLYLKFQMVVNGITNGDAKLLEAIDFYVTSDVTTAMDTWTELSKFASEEYKLAPGYSYAVNATEGTEAGSILYLVGHMKEEADNQYQDLTIDGVGITVYATQVEAEFDSFDNKYDVNATYEPWAGDVASATELYSLFDAETNTLTISTAAQLAAFAAHVNGTLENDGATATFSAGSTLAAESYAGITVKLADNINLNNIFWTPIGGQTSYTYTDAKTGKEKTATYNFEGTFDGGNYTIQNLNAVGENNVGLFGMTTATIQNLKIENAVVTGARGVGAVAGLAYTGKIDNCHVTGNIRITGNYKVGGITGGDYAAVTNCSVIGNVGSFVKGVYAKADYEGDNVGGIMGYRAEGNAVMTNCKAEINVEGTRKVGGIVGTIGRGTTIENCSYSGTVSCNADPVYAADNTGKLFIGGIAGEAPHSGTVNVNNCTVSGALVGLEADKTNAVIGGTRKSDAVLNVTNCVCNVETLIAVNSAKLLLSMGGKKLEGTYVLTADIDLNGAAMPTIGAAYGKSLTIDGNGHTISNATTAHTSHNGMKHHGFFYAYTDSTLNISDLTFDKVVIDATKDTERNYGAAVVVAFADGGSTVNLTNVDVRNSKVLNNTPDLGDEAGVYVGYQTGTLNMVDCDSTGCEVVGETAEKTGAFIGMVNGTATLTNCTTDLTIGACNRVSGTLTIDGNEVIHSQTDLNTAVASGGDVVLAAGNYTMPSTSADVTITGTKDTKVELPYNAVSGNGNVITFDGVTVIGETDSSWYSTLFNGAEKVVYKNCDIYNQLTTYCDSEFINCNFYNTFENDYSVYCYSGSTIKFDGCSFDTKCSKAIKVYDEGNGGRKVYVNDCSFTTETANKAAVEIDSTYSVYYIYFTGENTLSGAYTKLWNSDPGEDQGTNVYINGVKQ